jgi:hypothetical protein
MSHAQAAVAILDQVQVLDQEVAATRPIGEQRLHLDQRLRIELSPLGMRPTASTFAAPDPFTPGGVGNVAIFTHTL